MSFYRPAVVIAPEDGKYSDVFVVPITSRISTLNTGEYTLKDWIIAGLNVPSAVKRGCVLFQFQIKALSSLVRLRLLNVLSARLRRLNPRRLDIILDLKLELVDTKLILKKVGACSKPDIAKLNKALKLWLSL